MKKAIKVYSWVILAVLAQCAVLFLIDAVYLPHRGVGKAVIEDYDSVLNGKDSLSVKLPDKESKNIQVSFDGEYISYIKGNDICIYSTANKKIVRTLSDSGKKPIVTEWLPDRNILMFSFKTQEDKPGEVKLWTYNADIDKERYYEDVIAGIIPPGSYLTSLNFSPKTNVVYLNVKVGDNIAYVYRYNIMDFYQWVMNSTPDMLFKQTYQTDHFIYSPYQGTLEIRNGSNGQQMFYYFDSDVHIVGSDFSDNIYFGLLNNEGKISELKYGKYDEGYSKGWKTIKPETPANKEDIFFSMTKKPFYINRQSSTAVDLTNGNNTKFSEGKEIVAVLEKYIVSTDGTYVIFEKLKGESDE